MRVAAYLVLIKNGKALLSQRKNSPHHDGMYSLVAGHLDGNETIAGAMRREAKEEVDLDVEEKALSVIHAMHYIGQGPEYIYFFLSANTWMGEPKNMEPEKCGDLDWFPIAELPDNTVPYIRQVFEHIKNGVTFSEWKEQKI